jgi:hypothetical protein
VARAFAARGAGVFGRVEARLLTDRDANRAGLERGLAWLRDATGPSDRAVVYYAGHTCNELSGDFRFAPGGYSERHWRQTTVTAPELRRAVAAIPARTVVLLDTCYTGLMIDGRAPDARGPAYIGATRAAEQTKGGNLFRNCDFTRALIAGLDGAADDDGDGVVTLGELDAYLGRRVTGWRGRAQHVVSSVPRSWWSLPLASARP